MTNVGAISGSFEFQVRNALVGINKSLRELKKLNSGIDNTEKKSRSGDKAVNRFGQTINTTGKKAKTSGKSIDQFGNKIGQSSKKIKSASVSTKLLSREMGMLSSTMGALSIGIAGIGIIKLAKDIEDGFVGVKRTTGLAGQGFEDLRFEIMKLSGELRGIDLSGLQSVARIGGLLGIASKDISEFTEVVAKSSRAMDLQDEMAANYLARIAQNMGEPIENLIKVANTANHLGNTTKATAGEILEISQRVSGLAKTVGITTPELIGLSAVTRDLGESLEVGGSAWNRVLAEMLSNVEKFAHVSGVSLEEFSELVEKKPYQAILKFLDGLSKLNKQGKVKALEDLQLSGVRVMPMLLKLSANMDRVRKVTKLANDEWQTGASVEREYNAATNTLTGSLSQLWNSVKMLADAIGNSGLGKAIGGLADGLGKAIRYMAGYKTTADDVSKSLFKQSEQAINLREKFDKLADKQGKSREEQDKLNNIASDLSKILPGITIQYNDQGDAVGYLADEFERLNRAKKEEAISAKKSHMRDLFEEQNDIEREVNRKTELRSIEEARGNHNLNYQKEFTLNELGLTGEDRDKYDFKNDKVIQAIQKKNVESLASYEDALNKTKQRYKKHEQKIDKIKEEIFRLEFPEQAKKKDLRNKKIDPKNKDNKNNGGNNNGGNDYNPLDNPDKDTKQTSRSAPYDLIGASTELDRTRIEQTKRRATLTATGIDEQIEIERNYYNQLKELADKEYANNLNKLQSEQEFQEKYEIFEQEHNLKIEDMTLDFQEREKQLRDKAYEEQQRDLDKAHQKELRALEKQNRERERRLRDFSRSFQRILSPLWEGGKFSDVLKNMFGELMSGLSASIFDSMTASSNQSSGSGLFGALSGLFSGFNKNSGVETTTEGTTPIIRPEIVSTPIGLNSVSSAMTAKTPYTEPIKPNAPLSIPTEKKEPVKPNRLFSLPKPEIKPVAPLALPQLVQPAINATAANNQKTFNSPFSLTINTNGGAFDMNAAQSLQKYVNSAIEQKMMKDRRTGGKFSQMMKR